ncbi:MAG: DUF4136 domain-containing protein [Pseudomonadota bacterium]
MKRATILALALLLLGGCSTAPNVVTDFDREADFGRYQTFGFVEKSGETVEEQIVTLTEKRIRNEISQILQQRGYQASANPDMLVNFRITTRTKQYASPAYAGYYSRFRFYPYHYGSIAVREYKEGTIVIDLVDAAQKQLIWQGAVSGKVTRDAAQAEANTREAVRTIMQQYPHRAGRGVAS